MYCNISNCKQREAFDMHSKRLEKILSKKPSWETLIVLLEDVETVEYNNGGRCLMVVCDDKTVYIQEGCHNNHIHYF